MNYKKLFYSCFYCLFIVKRNVLTRQENFITLTLIICARLLGKNLDSIQMRLEKNNDGSMDIGIMQINTSNIQGLRNVFPAISVKNLLKYPCFNISVGGYILNENFKRYGRKWLAVGVYNAGSKNNGKRIVIRYNYAKDVNKYYNQIKNRSLILPRVS